MTANLSGRRESTALTATNEAFGSLGAALALKPVDLDCLFRTLWKAAETREERWLCLQTAKARGLNPLKGELMVSKRGGQLTFQTSYYVFVSRARRGGWEMRASSPVWEKDEWGGWDAVTGMPVKHVQTAFGDRGRLLGAWATLKRIGGTDTVGALMELGDLAISPQWGKDDNRWKETARADVWEAIRVGAYGPFWQRAPGRQGEKCVFAHLARRMVPDLESLYLPEEVGGDSESAPKAPIDLEPRRATVVEPERDGTVIDADFEDNPTAADSAESQETAQETPATEPAKDTPAEPSAPAAQPEAAPAAEQTTPPDRSLDEQMLAANTRLGQKHRRVAGELQKKYLAGREPGQKLRESEKLTMVRAMQAAYTIAEADPNEVMRLIHEDSLVPLLERLERSAAELVSNG